MTDMFALIRDHGFSGDALVGVYSSLEKAQEAANACAEGQFTWSQTMTAPTSLFNLSTGIPMAGIPAEPVDGSWDGKVDENDERVHVNVIRFTLDAPVNREEW